MQALAKKKESEAVGEWQQSITNHVYWVAASTKDDEEEMRAAKWTSLTNHIQGVHQGHSELFPRCLHPNLDGERQKKWLKPGNLNLDLFLQWNPSK